MTDGCLVCEEVAGGIPLPGGRLLDEEHLIAFHLPPHDGDDVYLGRLMIVSRRHTPGFEDLSPDEAAAVGVAISRLASALRAQAGADHVFVARIGTGQPHLHVHLLPRYPETPRDVPWHRVDEWEGARRGGFEDAAELASALRGRL